MSFKLAAGQTKNYYFRAKDGNLFTKGEMIRTTNDTYFEYIGANHVDKATEIQFPISTISTMFVKCVKNSMRLKIMMILIK